jgi:hypothetical protein
MFVEVVLPEKKKDGKVVREEQVLVDCKMVRWTEAEAKLVNILNRPEIREACEGIADLAEVEVRVYSIPFHAAAVR